MDYLQRIDKNPYDDLLWNVPEQKLGTLNIIGGNAQNFRTSVKTAEFIEKKYQIKETRLILPDALAGKLPELPNIVFLKSTESGSFASSEELLSALDVADFNLIIGDLSKNSITGKAVVSACQSSAKPVLITRDAVDILAENCDERTLMNENLLIMGSLAQLIKLFRAVYYPKMLTLTQSLLQVTEALHKFTVSFPVGIVTLQNGQIIVAKDGRVVVFPLDKTAYSPISLWMGEAAAHIATLNLYNPGKIYEATVAGLFA
ncbi:hypothetical protein IJ118_03325 [Candidatus Saccharibacteria bacterium]|nr:hypothetical protein [Candidatus Saccharibacteria bacterium]